MWNRQSIQMAKFALVGLLNTGVDFAVFLLMVYGADLPALAAQTISYGAGVANSYWWNRKWTFRAAGRGSWDEAVRFAVVNGLSFVLGTAVLLVFVQALSWPPAAAKGASIVLATAVNYAGSRYWVFRMESRQNRAG